MTTNINAIGGWMAHGPCRAPVGRAVPGEPCGCRADGWCLRKRNASVGRALRARRCQEGACRVGGSLGELALPGWEAIRRLGLMPGSGTARRGRLAPPHGEDLEGNHALDGAKRRAVPVKT